MQTRDFFLRPDFATATGTGSVTVSPSNTVDLPQLARCLFVENAGTVCFICADGSMDTWTVNSRSYVLVAVARVMLTGTSASGIHAIW